MSTTNGPAGVVGAQLRRAWTWVRLPEGQTELVQVAKMTLATVVAWLIAVRVLGLAQGFLAAYAALLTIHATVYSTFWRGAQSIVATVLGIVLSYLAVSTLGFGALSLGAAVLLGLLVARTPLIREEGIAVATTAVFVITAGYSTQEALLVDRFLDTLIGVAVGVVINVLVVPPLDDRIAEEALDRATSELGALMQRMAAELRSDMDGQTATDWIETTREIDARLDRAQEHLTFTQESQWANLRRRRSARTVDVDEETALLVRLEEGVAQTRTIARVVDESVVSSREWEDHFRRDWTELLGRTGRRIADPDLVVKEIRPELDQLTRELSHEELPGLHWPVYGALIAALHNVLLVVDDVASTRSGLRPRS